MRKINQDKLNHLGRLRENSNLDRQTAAQKLECSEAFLSQIEKKGSLKKPSVNVAQKMCEVYGCSLDDIYPKKKAIWG